MSQLQLNHFCLTHCLHVSQACIYMCHSININFKCLHHQCKARKLATPPKSPPVISIRVMSQPCPVTNLPMFSCSYCHFRMPFLAQFLSVWKHRTLKRRSRIQTCPWTISPWDAIALLGPGGEGEARPSQLQGASLSHRYEHLWQDSLKTTHYESYLSFQINFLLP